MTINDPMPLSQAIRLGATLKRQSFGRAYGIQNTTSCALAAAADAVGEDYYTLFDGVSLTHWPELNFVATPCPACTEVCNWSRFGLVTHLNDDHRWSRERIADFVQQHESAGVSEAEKAVEQVLI